MSKRDNDSLTKVTQWVHIWGQPGYHGDVIRIGFGNEECYLEITNDGFPNPGASGGMLLPLPRDVVRGSKLDARKFVAFYRSVYPGGPDFYDFSDPIWIYKATPDRPKGLIEVIQHLSTKENKHNGTFSFEKTITRREVVKAAGEYYIRVTEYECTAESNGRPVYSYTENYHFCSNAEIKLQCQLLTADSGLDFAAKTASYRYEERGTGVLF